MTDEAAQESATEIPGRIRRTDLMFLPNVGASIREALTEAGIDEERWIELCSDGISAHCTICDEMINGAEWAQWLLAVGTDEAAPARGMRFIRLARGCCANERCNARFYNLNLTPHPDFDWGSISLGALETKEPEKPISAIELAGDAAKESIARQFSKRTAAALVLFALLWLFHQWYRGGEIPIIRPAKDYSGEVPVDAEFLKTNPR